MYNRATMNWHLRDSSKKILVATFILLSINIYVLIRKEGRYRNCQLDGNGCDAFDVPEAEILKPALTILFWTPVWGVLQKDRKLTECLGIKRQCVITSRKSSASIADAIVFHAADSQNIEWNSVERNQRQRFVFASMEPPSVVKMRQLGIPNKTTFFIVQIEGLCWGRTAPSNYYFNWTMTYLQNSEANFSYALGEWVQKQHFRLDSRLHEVLYEAQAANFEFPRTENSVFAAISNCETESKRERFVEELARHYPVRLVGKCGPTSEFSEKCPRSAYTEDCTRTETSKHAFFLALENSICNDYVTEKYWHRIYVNSIPIVWSRRSFGKKKIPPYSVIFVEDFPNIRSLARFLKRLSENEKEYRQYFEWRGQGWIYVKGPHYLEGLCHLCTQLAHPPTHSPIAYRDVVQWIEDESHCTSYEHIFGKTRASMNTANLPEIKKLKKRKVVFG